MPVDVERKRRENQPLDKPAERPIGTRHIQILLDRSGSMESMKAAMEEAFGSFLKEQKAIPGAEDIRYVLSTFDTQGVDDVEVGNLFAAKSLVLVPRGGTPLYRSLLTTIERAEKRMKEDDVMLFVVITDGANNEGETSLDDARKAIAKKMDAGWAFIYLGANQDAWAVGGVSLGMQQGTTLGYAANAVGTRRMSAAMSATATLYRGSNDRDALRNIKVQETKIDVDALKAATKSTKFTKFSGFKSKVVSKKKK